MTKPTRQPTEEEWLEILVPQDRWNERAMLALIAVFGTPPSIVDFGCGTGAMMKAAARQGIEAWGFDEIVEVREERTEAGGLLKTRKADLRNPLRIDRKFAWGLCLEVAEHIPERYSGVLVNTITRYIMDGGWLFFSAAPPGQAGDGHCNLKPPFHWRTMLHKRNFIYRDDLTIKTRLLWQLVPMPMQWLPANIQVFSKQADMEPDESEEDGKEE